MRVVGPARPAAAWRGGKIKLAGKLCEMIDGVTHGVYAEPFVGMGGVFLRRERAPKVEAINDADGELINFFRILQRHYPYFMDMIKFQVASRAEFQRLRRIDPSTLTDLERASRFLLIQSLTFGGRVVGQSFGYDTKDPPSFNVQRLGPVRQAIHERLCGVTIDCLDWAEFLRRWDRPETLFYLDPPYYGTEGHYAATFPRADHEALAGALKGLQGRFILTMNDCAETWAIYGGLGKVESVELTYTAAGGRGAKRAGEIIVSRL